MNAHSWLYLFYPPSHPKVVCAFVFRNFFRSAVVGHNFLVLLPGQSTEADCQLQFGARIRIGCVLVDKRDEYAVIVVATSFALLGLCLSSCCPLSLSLPSSVLLFLVSCSRNYRLNAFALSVLFDIFIRWPAHLVQVAVADDVNAASIYHHCHRDMQISLRFCCSY